MIPTCPECSGPQLVDHPGGWLEFQHGAGCPVRDREDATRAADFERRDPWFTGVRFQRPATATERQLLGALGYQVPAGLTTVVEYLSATVRCRRWPTLEARNT